MQMRNSASDPLGGFVLWIAQIVLIAVKVGLFKSTGCRADFISKLPEVCETLEKSSGGNSLQYFFQTNDSEISWRRTNRKFYGLLNEFSSHNMYVCTCITYVYICTAIQRKKPIAVSKI